MKKFKMGALALALALGVGGAFATTSHASSKLLNPNWQTSDSATGMTIPVASGGVYDPNRTKSQAQADFGCSSNVTLCASTVNSQDAAPNGSASIYKN